MIERNTEAYLKIHREELERASAHRRLLREARDARTSLVAADRPARFGVVRHLARAVLARLDRPLRT